MHPPANEHNGGVGLLLDVQQLRLREQRWIPGLAARGEQRQVLCPIDTPNSAVGLNEEQVQVVIVDGLQRLHLVGAASFDQASHHLLDARIGHAGSLLAPVRPDAIHNSAGWAFPHSAPRVRWACSC